MGILSKLFTEFYESGKLGGIILIICTILTLIFANSPFSAAYFDFWHHYTDLSFGPVNLKLSNEHWVNDALMTIFFLMVGLEIERELYVGELRSIKKASLPIAAAIGGMALPALIHFSLNVGRQTVTGYGIPMATDIAFSLGILSLLGNRVPTNLKIFLTALAIIDDLGAVAVIAVFYTEDISNTYLFTAIGIFLGLMILNRMGVRKLLIYLIPGVVMWYCMLQSGVHATITGILLAFALPFTGEENNSNPSYALQHFLHKPVSFVILPIFAIANTGIPLSAESFKSLSSPNSLGISLGLFFGKPIGIFLACFLMVKTGLGRVPFDMNYKTILGAGILAGIGFTMSVFITNLAFSDPDYIVESKLAILLASLLSGIAGFIFLKRALNKTIPVEESVS